MMLAELLPASKKRKSLLTKISLHCIDALVTMNHRCGFINGEGDGVGIHIDIPGHSGKRNLQAAEVDPGIVDQDTFIVGHFLFKQKDRSKRLKIEVKEKLLQHEAFIDFRNG